MFKLLWLVAGVTSQQKGSLLESQLDQAFCVEFTYCRCRCGFFFFSGYSIIPQQSKNLYVLTYMPLGVCESEWCVCPAVDVQSVQGVSPDFIQCMDVIGII